MSNCVVSSAQERPGEACIPGGVVADHGVQGGDNLSHDGDDGDLRFLPGGREALVEGFERRIISTGSHGRHVEYSPDRCAAAPDAAHAFEFATVEVVGGDPDDCGDLPAAHLTEFRQ